jgi:hypothetical protein
MLRTMLDQRLAGRYANAAIAQMPGSDLALMRTAALLPLVLGGHQLNPEAKHAYRHPHLRRFQ